MSTKPNRKAQLDALRADFESGKVSAEVATKSAAKFLSTRPKDGSIFGQAVILWNKARNQVAINQKDNRGRIYRKKSLQAPKQSD